MPTLEERVFQYMVNMGYDPNDEVLKEIILDKWERNRIYNELHEPHKILVDL